MMHAVDCSSSRVVGSTILIRQILVLLSYGWCLTIILLASAAWRMSNGERAKRQEAGQRAQHTEGSIDIPHEKGYDGI